MRKYDYEDFDLEEGYCWYRKDRLNYHIYIRKETKKINIHKYLVYDEYDSEYDFYEYNYNNESFDEIIERYCRHEV